MGSLGWIEIVFMAAALGFGLWQYISVSREIERDRVEQGRVEQEEREGRDGR